MRTTRTSTILPIQARRRVNHYCPHDGTPYQYFLVLATTSWHLKNRENRLKRFWSWKSGTRWYGIWLLCTSAEYERITEEEVPNTVKLVRVNWIWRKSLLLLLRIRRTAPIIDFGFTCERAVVDALQWNTWQSMETGTSTTRSNVFKYAFGFHPATAIISDHFSTKSCRQMLHYNAKRKSNRLLPSISLAALSSWYATLSSWLIVSQTASFLLLRIPSQSLCTTNVTNDKAQIDISTVLPCL